MLEDWGGGAGRGGGRRGGEKGHNLSFLKLKREGRRAWAEQIVFFIVAGEGYDVHVAADTLHRQRGIHDSPHDVLDQVEAYPGSIGGILNELFG